MRANFNLGAALLLAVPVLGQNGCKADNCERAILNAQSSAARASDCSSLLVCTSTMVTKTSTSMITVTPTTTTLSLTTTPATSTTSSVSTPSTTVVTTSTSASLIVVTSTVTPSAVTTTVTTTAAPTFAKRGDLLRRQGQTCPGFTLPAYASACSSFARYSSACSCAGVTGSTVTVPTGTLTVTSTTTLAQVTITAATTASGAVTTILSTAPTPTSTVTVTISASTSTTLTTLATSTTTTTTVSTGSALPTPAACNNQGVQFAFYNDTQPAGTSASNGQFDPTVVKNKQPMVQGVTNYMRQNIAINNYYPPNASDYVASQGGVYFILDHRGYIFTSVTGTYTFTASNVDDIVFTWFSSTAYSGWNQYNSASMAAFNNGRGTATRTAYLQAGQYFAFRVLFKQAIGDDTFSYSITAPNGQVLIGSDPSAAASGYVVQFACGDTSSTGGAPYPAFGAET